jgi:hypothetical protein
MEFIELTEDQRRQFIDSEQVFQALEVAEEEAWRHRGSMFWREQAGRNYLVKLEPDSSQKGLGVESPQTKQTFDKFMTRKAQVEQRVKALREQAETMKRLNRALRVGRTPDIIIDVINALKKARVGEHFLLVGTNALYAYETAAGVRFPHEVLATRDADFLYDTRKRGEFLQVMDQRGLSFLELLRKADKTFERHPEENHTAVNSKGYEIDVIRRFPPPELEAAEHPMRMTDDEHDLWAMRASTGQQLLSVPRFKQVVVGVSGAMATLTTVHPLEFARVKHALSKKAGRDPHKAPKDEKQATMVEALVEQYLPHLAQRPAADHHDDDDDQDRDDHQQNELSRSAVPRG